MKLKNDKYRRQRGGQSRLLALYCEKCKNFLFNYQKDGSGILKRLYIDRILSKSDSKRFKTSKLTCSRCKILIGIPIVYKKENRPALRLFAGAIIKKPLRIRT